MTDSTTADDPLSGDIAANDYPRFLQLYQSVILSRPWITFLVLIAGLAFMGFQAGNYKIDASADSLVLEGDVDLEFYREVGKRYASEEYLVIAYPPKHALLDEATLSSLALLVDELQSVEGVSTVVSILDAPLLYSPKISITEISDEIGTLRNGGVDKSLVLQEFRESPIYRQLIASEDAGTTAIQVNLERDETYVQLLEQRNDLRKQRDSGNFSSEQKALLKSAELEFKHYATTASEAQRELVSRVRSILDQHRAAATAVYLGGVPMIAADMVAFVQSDLQYFGLGILVFIIVLLTVIFRAFRWVVLPLLACLSTTVFMLGLLGWLDWRMTVISSNFVALLLIITLAIAVHLIVRFRELQGKFPTASALELATETVRLMIKPCLYTGLTTIVAFMSLVISGIRPVIDFGWMMTIGVSVALILAFIVVPAGMVLFGKVGATTATHGPDESKAFTLRFATTTEKYGPWIIVISALIFVLSVLGMTRLEVENRFIDYFDESTEIYQGMELIDSELGGTIPLELVLLADEDESGAAGESGDEFDEFDEFGEFEDEFDEFADEFSSDDGQDSGGYWFTTAGLAEIEQIHDHIESLGETGKVLSLATVYKVAKDLLGTGIDDIQLALAYQKLPPSIKEIMIDPYLSVNDSEARISVRVMETSHTLRRAELLASLDSFMQEEMGMSPDRYRFTGMLVLYNNMLQSLFSSQIMTLGVVFVSITLMLVILFQSVYLAFIGIVPNVMAALLVLGGMGLAGVPLDMMTITIAAISIGIGVDNTIHYIHRYKREFPQDKNYLATMYRCHGSIGRAMYYTSVTIIFGFSILAFSNFKPSIYFGLLTGVAMLSALMGSLMLLPRLLILLKPLGR